MDNKRDAEVKAIHKILTDESDPLHAIMGPVICQILFGTQKKCWEHRDQLWMKEQGNIFNGLNKFIVQRNY